MQWFAGWWIFPLGCMVMMALMFLFMAGVGRMGCMPRMRWTGRPDRHEGAGPAHDERSPGGGSAG